MAFCQVKEGQGSKERSEISNKLSNARQERTEKPLSCNCRVNVIVLEGMIVGSERGR